MEAMLKLWKGLFYCMWMCDKRPVQVQRLAADRRMVSLHPLCFTPHRGTRHLQLELASNLASIATQLKQNYGTGVFCSFLQHCSL
jgi:hypothetical protein